MIKKNILVTGGHGLVGTAIQHISKKYSEYNWIFLKSKECDLNLLNGTDKYFSKIKPYYVIHLAAKVGGLFKNMNQKSEMFECNISINTNVLKCCKKYNVKKVVSCLSTCIFPDKTNYPIDETMLHDGPPHFSNDAYAYAKRMLEVHSRIYREQFDIESICIIPTNVYGENDNYHLIDAHVIPALIHKCYLAKQNDEDFVVCGSGKPLRQFIYSKDLAELMLWSLFEYIGRETIILSPDEKEEVSIGDIATLIAKEFDYISRMRFDVSKPDGQYKKTASNKKLRTYLPYYKFTQIDDGMTKSVKWFIENYNIARK
jgi:GDP-L-fucose synthase